MTGSVCEKFTLTVGAGVTGTGHRLLWGRAGEEETRYQAIRVGEKTLGAGTISRFAD